VNEERIYECEIRILKKNPVTKENYYDWKIVPAREAIEAKISTEDVRCKGCHGRVKLLNQYGNVGNAPHAVPTSPHGQTNYTLNSGCCGPFTYSPSGNTRRKAARSI
jgi:hypothetical protein